MSRMQGWIFRPSFLKLLMVSMFFLYQGSNAYTQTSTESKASINKTKSSKEKKNMFITDYESLYTVGASSKLIREGEYTRAFVLLKKILAKNPNNKRAMFNIARIYTYSEEYNKAAYYFIQSGDSRYLTPESGWEYGISFYYMKDYPRAIKGLKRVPAHSSKKDTARFYIGVCYMEQANLFQALLNFKKAKNIPQELVEYKDKYIEYIESNLSPQDRKIAKKRYKRITRVDLPELPGGLSKESKSKSSKKKPSIFSLDITPSITQSIDYESTEYSTDFYELTSYNYKFGLKTDFKINASNSSSSLKKTTFSLSNTIDLNSCGAIDLVQEEAEDQDGSLDNGSTDSADSTGPSLGIDVSKLYPDDEIKQDLLKSMFQVCYAPTTSSLQDNFKLKVGLTPRIDIPLGSLGKQALLYGEYTLEYSMLSLTEDNTSVTHSVYAGFDKIGSSSIYGGIKVGFEYEDSSTGEKVTETLSSDSYLSFSPVQPLTLSLLFESEHPMNTQEETSDEQVELETETTSPPAEMSAGGLATYKFQLDDINTLTFRLKGTVPVSTKETSPDKEGLIVNSDLLYSLTHSILGINLFVAANNLTSEYTYYAINPNISLSVASVLFLSLYDDFSYFTRYAYKDEESESESGYSFSEAAHTNITYASISYTPFSWLKLAVSYLFLYNEFNLPDNISSTFYTTQNPYSTTKITGLLQIAYTF